MQKAVTSIALFYFFKRIQLERLPLCLFFKTCLTILCLIFLIVGLKAQPDSTFKKALISDKEMVPVSIEPVPNGGFIVGGLERGTNEREWTGFMLKLSEKGEPEWKRAINSDTSGNFQQVKPLKEDGFIGVNNYLRDRGTSGTFTASALTWCKTNASGTIQWAKTIREGQLQSLPAIDMEITEDGSIYTIGNVNYGATINRLDAQGNPLMNPTNFSMGGLTFFDMSDLLISQNKELIIVGSTNNDRLNNVFRGTILKVTDELGRFTSKSSKAYVGENIDINFKKAFNTDDGGLIVVGIVVPNKHLLVKLDKDGNVQWGKFYATGLIAYTPKESLKTKDNGIIMTGYNEGNTILFKVDASGNLLWARNINAEPLSVGLLAETQSGNILSIGNGYRFQNTNERGIDFYITLFDKNGVPNDCTHTTANITVESRNFTVQNLNPTYNIAPTSIFKDHVVESSSKTVQSKPICKCISVGYLDTTICRGSTIKIASKIYDTDVRDTLLLKNQYGCDSLLFIKLSTTLPITKTIEATICRGDSYKFDNWQLTETGTYPLKFIAKSGCDSTVMLNLFVKDTFTKNIEAKICEGESYLFLNKTFTKSGVYTEKVKGRLGCDSTFLLNLTVNTKPILQNNNEQTFKVSVGDTISLKACAQGMRYEWTPQKSVSCTTCDTPSVFTSENVLIKAKITHETGCFIECNYQILVKNKVEKSRPFDAPNVFSPNSDGNNDFFQVRSPKIKLLSLEIYNRWGALIFRQMGENAEWDGSFNGKILPNDVFVYLIRYSNLETQKEEIAYGDISLMR